MKTAEMRDLLALLARSANAAAKKHGVHYYEHEHNGQWRPCPEAFAVHASFEAVRAAGYGVATEAHQGGVWILGDREDDLPRGASRRRYDLAIWPKRPDSKKPAVLCEFKWLFGKQSFLRDAYNLSLARNSIGSEVVLCLLVAHGSRERVQAISAAREQELAKSHDIRLVEASSIQTTGVYRYGRETDDPPVFLKSIAFGLQ